MLYWYLQDLEQAAFLCTINKKQSSLLCLFSENIQFCLTPSAQLVTMNGGKLQEGGSV